MLTELLVKIFHNDSKINKMKKLILIFTISGLLYGCSTKDEPIAQTPLSQLPAATQTGANTFGCLLDGQVFKPDLGNNNFQCYYQFINGEYFFYIRGSKRINAIYSSVYIVSKNKQIAQGQEYDLKEEVNFGVFGALSIGLPLYITSKINTGKLKITKLDEINQIVSGTFFFDVVNNQGVKHEIRDGRFDSQYTR